MIISQEQYSVLKQPMQNRYIKIYLLDFNMQIVDEISGNVTSTSITISSDADIRRTCNISLIVNDSSFDIQAGGKIWLNRYIEPYIGTYDIHTDSIIWNKQGIFLINAPRWYYNSMTNQLSFEGIDLVSKLTGLRNGQLEGIDHVILQGENVRSAIIGTLAEAGFTKYIISECTNRDGTIQSVPYDITISAGGTVWDILTELRDILPNYQMYFDIDGVFHYEPIPTGEDEDIILDDDLLVDTLISEQIDTDFESVKNYIEVWGTTHDVEYFSNSTTISSNVISLTITGFTPTTGDMIGWESSAAVTSSSGIKLNVNSIGATNLVDVNGDNIESLQADTYYVASYLSNGKWLFMGHLQAQAVWADYNPNSPFYINGEAGIIRKVCSGSDYDNIMTDDLALERARVEVYWQCRLNDKITLTTVPIPWLDVNTLIEHNNNQWMIDSINSSYDYNGTMTINAHKYYPYYPMI